MDIHIIRSIVFYVFFFILFYLFIYYFIIFIDFLFISNIELSLVIITRIYCLFVCSS